MVQGIPVQRVEVVPGEEPDLTELNLDHCKGVVLSGGNDSVYDEDSRRVPQDLLDLPVPKLGICYGQQALVHQSGGEVRTAEEGEHGVTDVTLHNSPLFEGFQDLTIKAMMNHRDVVASLPEGFQTIAESPAGIAGVTNGKDIYAVQYHPESSDTEFGSDLLLNFATEVCGMVPDPDFNEDTYRQLIASEQAEVIRQQLGEQHVRAIMLSSGGVDSAVAHVLSFEALKKVGRQDVLTAITVDTGMMRHEDGDTIRTMQEMGYPIEVHDYSQFFLHEPVPVPMPDAKKLGMRYLPPMDSVTDPRIMRKINKYGFVEVHRLIGERIREQFSDAEIIALLQGTNLADVIESGELGGDQVKEHHNSGLEALVDRLVEPLRGLLKGDIRKLARDLGLPEEIAGRQPFPGPGLCIRIGANDTGETVWPDDISERRQKLEELCRKVGNGAMTGAWLPFMATGQRGDSRIIDYMTVVSGKYDPELLEKLSKDIPGSTGASRVLFTSQEVDPDKVQAVRQMVNEDSLGPLREVEESLRQSVKMRPAFRRQISQYYAASLPFSLDGGEQPTAMVRLFATGIRSGLEDYLTGEAAYGGLNTSSAHFKGVLSQTRVAAAQNGYSGMLYDATHKPPGTVELS